MQRTPDIGFDLGNSKFSICVAGEGVVASESSWLAFRGQSREESALVAFGDEAGRMAEHAHPGMSVVCPMREGIVIDSRMASLLLRKLARKAGVRTRFARPKTVVATLFGASDVERKAFVDVASSMSTHHNTVIDEPLAAAYAIPDTDIEKPTAKLILDVGDGATEAMIISMGRPVLGRSIRFGGSHVDQMLIHHVRKQHGLTISRAEARRIKEKLSHFGTTTCGSQYLSVKGLSIENHLPREMLVPVLDLAPVFAKVGSTVGDFIHNVLEHTPPELCGDLIENGIYLCGGGSKLAGLKQAIEMHSKLVVHPFDRPDQTVIRGINRILDRKRRI